MRVTTETVAVRDAPCRPRRSGMVRRPELSRRPRLLSVEEAADYLGISTGTMRNWLSMRRIEYVKVGRLTRVSQAALDRYITVNTVRPVNEHS
jgi:excisionase family DNA binding protein